MQGVRRDNADVAEQEANYFALLMLMPRGLFEEAMKSVRDSFDESGLSNVARQFQVSIPMVIARSKI